MTAKFWVGGTGTWDNSTTTHWSLSTGGAGGAAVPGAADTITFDGASGGGTVTVDTTINGLTFQSITMGAFTGTLDFSVNNPSITLGANAVPGISVTGTGVRILKLGSGTFTLKTTSNNCFDATTTTNLTYDTTSTATFNIVTNGAIQTQDFQPGSLTFPNNTYNVTLRSDGSMARLLGSTTFKLITFSGGSGYAGLDLPTGSTITVSNAVTWNGSGSAPIFLFGHQLPQSTKSTLALAAGSTLNWGILTDIAVTGLTLPATNSTDLGNNSGVTFTAPSAGGGGGGIIGS